MSVSVSVKNIAKKGGIQVHFKPSNTIRSSLVKPKDKVGKDKQSGVIYSVKCSDPNCSALYVGETGRSIGERIKEHATHNSSALKMHHMSCGHPPPSLDQTSILQREERPYLRYIKESIYIRAMSPALNRNIGKFDLPPIWNNVIKKDHYLSKIHF